MNEDSKLSTMVDERIRAFLKGKAFTARKIGDTPTDALSLVPRKYLTNNGTVANRPNSSVATIGQPYLATDTGIPMVYTENGWVNGVGSVVASA